ncbi:MAG TPA: histidinol-phosphate transaminase [Ardenticatenaceae bacterium]|jgi:histidinol-phosphate aminotransferase
MTDPLDLIKPQVRAMKAYTLKPYQYQYRMNQNENPLGFPAELKEKVWERLREADWARYPDFNLVEVTESVAQYAGVRPSQVLVGNGSNEMIYNAMAVTLGAGDHIVIPVPTFSVYKLIATVMGATVHEPRMVAAQGFALPTDEVIETARAHGAKMVVICTPNNPTAQSYPMDEVRRVCAESGAIVLIDEAYQEFSSQNLLPLVEEFPNVVLLRTFSKALALGGLRVGYAITNEALATEIHKGKLPYALNAFSAAAVVVALEHRSAFDEEIALIKAERERLFAALEALPIARPVPSDANFILTHFEGFTPQQVFDSLLERGILIRDVSSYPELGEYLRISVGAPHENDALIGALQDLVVE